MKSKYFPIEKKIISTHYNRNKWVTTHNMHGNIYFNFIDKSKEMIIRYKIA